MSQMKQLVNYLAHVQNVNVVCVYMCFTLLPLTVVAWFFYPFIWLAIFVVAIFMVEPMDGVTNAEVLDVQIWVTIAWLALTVSVFCMLGLLGVEQLLFEQQSKFTHSLTPLLGGMVVGQSAVAIDVLQRHLSSKR
jgi:hypothetical protein